MYNAEVAGERGGFIQVEGKITPSTIEKRIAWTTPSTLGSTSGKEDARWWVQCTRTSSGCKENGRNSENGKNGKSDVDKIPAPGQITLGNASRETKTYLALLTHRITRFWRSLFVAIFTLSEEKVQLFLPNSEREMTADLKQNWRTIKGCAARSTNPLRWPKTEVDVRIT